MIYLDIRQMNEKQTAFQTSKILFIFTSIPFSCEWDSINNQPHDITNQIWNRNVSCNRFSQKINLLLDHSLITLISNRLSSAQNQAPEWSTMFIWFIKFDTLPFDTLSLNTLPFHFPYIIFKNTTFRKPGKYYPFSI